MWPGDHEEEAKEAWPGIARPPTQARAANWAAPLPPSIPGIPARRISTPARLTGPPANSPLPIQDISVITSGGFAPGPCPTNQATNRPSPNMAAFSRFGSILALEPADLELGHRLLSDVSRANSASSELVQPDLT